MRQEIMVATLSILLSVGISATGTTFYYGQYVQQITQNKADISALQATTKEMRELVTQIRVDMATQNATVITKLDTLMEIERK